LENFFKGENIFISLENEAPKNWNNLIHDSKWGTRYQTKEYAQYRKKILGDLPIFMKFHKKNAETVGLLLLFQTRIGLKRLKKLFGDGLIFSFSRKLSSHSRRIQWAYGPIILDNNYKKEVADVLARFLIVKKYSFIGHQHPLDSLTFSKRFNFQETKNATFIIDLKENLEKILSNAKKNSVRKNIKRAEERGVTVYQTKSEKDVIRHYELLKEHRLRNNLIPHSKESVIENYRMGKSTGLTGFIAMYNEKPVGSITMSAYNSYITEQGITRSEIDIKKNLYSQDLLRWTIIKWGKKNNFMYYDLAGVKSGDRSKKEEGIFRNKEKWGGKYIEYAFFTNEDTK